MSSVSTHTPFKFSLEEPIVNPNLILRRYFNFLYFNIFNISLFLISSLPGKLAFESCFSDCIILNSNHFQLIYSKGHNLSPGLVKNEKNNTLFKKKEMILKLYPRPAYHSERYQNNVGDGSFNLC